jgi:chitin synthase
MKAAYVAWDQTYMDVVLQRGFYRGVPYLCIIKQQNRGKRDSLLVVRSVLYNFNIREEKPVTIFSGKFFAEVASFLLDNGMDDVPFLVGMDADTVFAPDNIHELLKQSRFPNTVGVCGYVAVDFTAGNWNLWKLYQSAEYTIAQALRRLHQSVVTHKVSCLPGCCQLLKVCEETCGDEVLIIKFGYCPTFKDNIFKQILATASEDRNHVCLMLSSRPKVQTRQALKAKAVTDVPQSWAVFLSQRRRWTLGATSNDLYLSTAPGVQWFERILATVNVLTWFLNPFIFASLASFIYAIFRKSSSSWAAVLPLLLVAQSANSSTDVEPWIVMCFVAVMLVPVWYYLCIPLWLLDTWLERFQFWAGMAIYVTCGPIINIAVLLYAVFNMDSFGWGKTRKVIADDSETDPALLADDASGSGSDGTPGVTSEKSSTPSTPPLVSDHSSRDSTPPPPLRTPPSPPTPPSNWETIRPPGPRKLQKRPRQKKFNCPLG